MNLENTLRVLGQRRATGYDPKLGRTRAPGPRSFQIQTVDRCNGHCVMCPHARPDAIAPMNLMDSDLFRHILGQLHRMGSVQWLTLMLQNEPLLDPDLPERVRTAREILGKRVWIGTVTNGVLLSRSRIDALLEAGISRICVSIDGLSEETYSRIRPGLDFARVVTNTRTLIDRAGGKKVSVVFLRQKANAAEQGAFVRYWERAGAEVGIAPLRNRAGVVEEYDQLRARDEISWRGRLLKLLVGSLPCMAGPFRRMPVLLDGRVLVCCQDWRARHILGDLSKQSLSDAWNGEPANRYRDLLWHNRLEESPICCGCSFRESFGGRSRSSACRQRAPEGAE